MQCWVYRISLLLALSYAWAQLHAQLLPDSLLTTPTERQLELRVEDAAIAGQVEEGADWSTIVDPLATLARHPLNLNKASQAELESLPGFTPILAARLRAHLLSFGPLLSIYELQGIEGFTAEVISRLRVYATVPATTSYDLTSPEAYLAPLDGAHPFGQGRWEAIQRLGRTLQPSLGYSPATLYHNKPTLRYLGDPQTLYTRVRYQYANRISIGLLGTKSAGERLLWDPAKAYYGYDYLSAHFYLRDAGRIRQLAVGDYTLQWGQGLIFSRTLGLAKGADPIGALKPPAMGVQPYLSANENSYLRGAAATVAISNLTLTGFASNIALDAPISGRLDSLGQESEGYASIQRSGLHRTATEIANRKSLTEQLAGLHASVPIGPLQLATTQAVVRYDRERFASSRAYQTGNFSGTSDYLRSLEADASLWGMNLFGEAAWSGAGNFAGIAGLLAAPHPRLELALQVRQLANSFHTLRGYAFTSHPGTVSNEAGMYVGLRLRPARRWTIASYLDRFTYPAPRYLVSAPSHGYDFFTQVDYSPSRKLNYNLRLRHEVNQHNLPTAVADTLPMPFPVGVTSTLRNTLRLEANYNPSAKWLWRTRMEANSYTQQGALGSQGWLLYQELRMRLQSRASLTLRATIFGITGANSRITTFQVNNAGAYSVPSFTGNGANGYLLFRFSPAAGWDVWVRIANSWRFGAQLLGTGLDQLMGSQRTDAQLQLRYQWGNS